ncbi:MAG TPA: hypothetical protein VMD08_01985 [Candidatus Baltobacteraceae bacterium]|nr:hypothetical protein [Candidatus Baltobacteraceae bacterium]
MARSKAIVAVFAMFVMAFAGTALAVEVGTKAPNVTLASPDGKEVKLSDLTAKGPVAIYTFIQAFTGT